MSWGERSCKKFGTGCNNNPTIITCNVDCSGYSWDFTRGADSKSNRIVFYKGRNLKEKYFTKKFKAGEEGSKKMWDWIMIHGIIPSSIKKTSMYE